MSAPKALLRLVETFDRNLPAYMAGAYKEAEVRAEFIDPLFELLGWDVHNKLGYAEAYKEVVREASLSVGGTTRAPDYSFRVGGVRKFFLEAKKPSVSVKDEPAPAYQVRRYAWSAQLPLSILTDFQEFAVYDCRVRPKRTDKPAVGRINYFTFDEYERNWDHIASVFSKEAILTGSFDRYAQASVGKRGTAAVDSEFLQEIERWRELLARNIALRNPGLTIHALNEAVQRTIDRIVFLRICEDRGIDTTHSLRALRGERDVYPKLFELFRRADDRYDSGLFHFQGEKGIADAPDTLTPSLTIDDKPLQAIIGNLYYPESPYEFSVLPADILGQVYERFLGKVIRLTAAHRAVVEDKPEVRKAGGVYYTPTPIVEYIVAQTVGALLTNKTPKEAETLRVVDPACGSGSFLLAAYQYLLNWHLRSYIDDGPSKHAQARPRRHPRLFQVGSGDWRLTTAERKRILLACIFGVDIDPQAVEVTKLSLLLKVLENETEETLEKQLRIFHERALPSLAGNIKCGNSLIGTDFRHERQGDLFDDERPIRVNAFDWQKGFPDVFSRKAPGFDAVIGNPPYIGFHGFMAEKQYLQRSYVSASGKFDFYLPFVEKGLGLLREGGLFGYICPTNFMKRHHGEHLRRLLRQDFTIREICDFEDVQVFAGATNYTGIFLFQNSRPKDDHQFLFKRRALDSAPIRASQAALGDSAWIVRDEASAKLVRRVKSGPVTPLSALVAGISEGIVTGKNDVFLLSRETAKSLGIEARVLRPCARGREIRRYHLDLVESFVLYPYEADGDRTVAIPERELAKHKAAWKYLTSKRRDLGGRGYFERSTKHWYELWCQRSLSLLAAPKILVPEVAESNRFALADATVFYGDTVCGIVLKQAVREDLKYLLGLLNSKLLTVYYKRATVPKANGFFIYKTMFLKNLPIRTIDFSSPKDVARHDRLVEMVDRICGLLAKLAAARSAHERTVLQRQADATDVEIDALVYDLYALTPAEIRHVEEAANSPDQAPAAPTHA